jgi:hypothetical protein
LWFQFFGPGHYRGVPFDPASYALDLKSYLVYGGYSLAGQADQQGLAPNQTEETSFLGVALIVLCVVVVVRLWRRPLVKALAGAVIVFVLLSLGNVITVAGWSTGLPGPYRLAGKLPLMDSVVPARFGLVVAPLLGLLLALSIDQIRIGQTRQDLRFRRLWLGAVAAVLLPLAPLPLQTSPAPDVPAFIASGEWRSYVPPGRTIVPAVPSGYMAVAGTLWSARTGLSFPVPGGQFNGPSSPDDPAARLGGQDRPTAILLHDVAVTGSVPIVTDIERRQMVEDLRYWRAAIVVLGNETHAEALRQTLDTLLGPGELHSGAWVWDVRSLVDA